MITRIAQLDRKITIKTPTVTVADSGQQSKTFATWRTCFAQVVEQYGNEDVQSGAVVAQTTVNFYVRHKSGLSHDMVINYRENDYNIKSITEAQYKGHFHRDRFQKITAILKDQPNTQQF